MILGIGPNDGSEHGERYFSCNFGKGIFVRHSAIKTYIQCEVNFDLKPSRNNRSYSTSNRLKAPKKPKHKTSRSISPKSRPSKNRKNERSKSKANPFKNINNGDFTYSRSKSQANIVKKPKHKKKRKSLNTLNKSKSLKPLELKNKDSNIKPSAYSKHKKRSSLKLKTKKKHNTSQSVEYDDSPQNNQMFDLHAILKSNNLDPLYDHNKSQKSLKKQMNIKKPPPKTRNFAKNQRKKNKPPPPPKRTKIGKVPKIPKFTKSVSFHDNKRRKDARSERRIYRERGIESKQNQNIKVPKEIKKRSLSANTLRLESKKKKNKNKKKKLKRALSSDDSDDEWECHKCLRSNLLDFRFCPKCGTKKDLKVEYFDNDSLSESKSDTLDQLIQNEEDQMLSIMDEMRMENDAIMEHNKKERDELKKLNKKDFIKTFDIFDRMIKDRKSSSSSSRSPSPIPPIYNDKKQKRTKSFSIKSWILSPNKTKISARNKHNNLDLNIIDNQDMMREESMSYSNVSHAYSINHYNDNDQLMPYKHTQNTLDLMPDTPLDHDHRFFAANGQISPVTKTTKIKPKSMWR